MDMKYCPRKGDIIMIDFNPQAGHEQAGRRPALVVSNDSYQSLTALCIVCPITNTDNGFPLHVGNIKDVGCKKTVGFVQVEHLRSVDYRARNAEFREKAPSELMDKVESYLQACMF